MDKEALFADRLPRAEVEVAGVGTVTVRALSRAEALRVDAAPSIADKERVILTRGLVDPVLTEAEVKRWQEAAPAGEIQPVAMKIAELSGLLDGADKEAYKSVRVEPAE